MNEIQFTEGVELPQGGRGSRNIVYLAKIQHTGFAQGIEHEIPCSTLEWAKRCCESYHRHYGGKEPLEWDSLVENYFQTSAGERTYEIYPTELNRFWWESNE